jgi:hypothetical protein
MPWNSRGQHSLTIIQPIHFWLDPTEYQNISVRILCEARCWGLTPNRIRLS